MVCAVVRNRLSYQIETRFYQYDYVPIDDQGSMGIGADSPETRVILLASLLLCIDKLGGKVYSAPRTAAPRITAGK